MFVIAGLGNPGTSYERTRHNVGFDVIESLMHQFGMTQTKSKYDALLTEGTIGDHKVLLVRPQTFMNASGTSIQKLMAFYKFTLDQLIVIHDELDLAVGKVRVKVGGGAAGHNGLRSIDKHVGQNYCRLRIGINHPGQKHLVEKYVLQKFTSDDRTLIDTIITQATDNFEHLLQGEYDLFMTRVNDLST